MRRLYDWVLSWADTPYGTPALFVISFAESSFFPIPPDVLQIALSAGKSRRSFWYAGVNLIGSVSGAVVGFLIGYLLWSAMQDFFYTWIFSRDTFAIVAGDAVAGIERGNPEDVKTGLYHLYGFWAVFIAAFTPIPYKVFTIAAGVCNLSLVTLVGASIIGRGARFFLVASLMFFCGPTIKTWIEKYFEMLAVVFCVLLVGGFVAVKFLLH